MDTDIDTDSLIEDDEHGVLCVDCAEKFGGPHPMSDVYVEPEVVQTIDLTPTWAGLLPIMLECIAEKGPHSDMRPEFVKMAKAADKWNEHCKEVNGG